MIKRRQRCHTSNILKANIYSYAIKLTGEPGERSEPEFLLPFTGELGKRGETVFSCHSLVKLANVANHVCTKIHW